MKNKDYDWSKLKEGNWERKEVDMEGKAMVFNIQHNETRKALEIQESDNSRVEQEPLKQENWRQEWENGTVDDKGYFVIINPTSGKVLTAAEDGNLSIEKSMYLQSLKK